jgi:hypothetical protein
MKKARQILMVIVICLLAIELLLRLSGVFKTASEKVNNKYVSSYGGVQSTWYSTYKPDTTIFLPATDFHYPFTTNKIGIRDKDYDQNKPDSVYRIVITGNSYVEGAGAPYDSTWPRLIEKELLSRNINAEVIDAGVPGSDVMYDYVFYRDVLRSYHPNLVIATMNNSDYVYYAFRGGMERFHADGTVHYLPIPWYDFLYHYSHLVRAVLAVFRLPLEGAYLSRSNYKIVASQATINFASVIKNFSDTAIGNKAKFALIIYPKPNEITLHSFFTQNIADNFAALSGLLDKDKIASFDITPAMKTRFKDRPKPEYTYPHDGHFKPGGYLIMAKLTVDSLMASGIIKR